MQVKPSGPMLPLTPPDKLRFNQTDLLRVNFGGSEANVAVSLANYGLRSELSAL